MCEVFSNTKYRTVKLMTFSIVIIHNKKVDHYVINFNARHLLHIVMKRTLHIEIDIVKS